MSKTATNRPPTTAPLRILGIAGSLCRGSYNRALLRAPQEGSPSGVDISLYDTAPLPFYNADVEAAGDPEPVRAFKEAMRDASALLIATPEYNHGVPGVLKNALDSASRPHRFSSLDCKPVAVMGATAGRLDVSSTGPAPRGAGLHRIKDRLITPSEASEAAYHEADHGAVHPGLAGDTEPLVVPTRSSLVQ
jgi:hypothetical protein